MSVVLVAALSGVVGALIALIGTLVAESLRQRGDHRQWRLDKLLELYSEMLNTSRQARNNAYEARRGIGDLDERSAAHFRSLLTKAELLASQDVINKMRRLNDVIHDDFHAAELDVGRKADPSFTTHHLEPSPWTCYDEWNRLRDAMHNAFRRDVGLDAAVFPHRERSAIISETDNLL